MNGTRVLSRRQPSDVKFRGFVPLAVLVFLVLVLWALPFLPADSGVGRAFRDWYTFSIGFEVMTGTAILVAFFSALAIWKTKRQTFAVPLIAAVVWIGVQVLAYMALA